ncbi:MAG: LuxR C-terminal-related transcriptional regulator [Candidatus Binatia bacterium]
MSEPLRVVIADDHALFRQGLHSMLRLHPELTVVAEVERAEQLLPLLDATPCDLLLLDLQMERGVVAEIEALAERVAIIVVTASERVEDALAAIRAGARALVFKRFAIETLMTAIATVREGHVWLPPVLQAEIAAGLRRPQPAALTRREREIARHVALGLRNAEVAERLSISELTVKTHLNNIFQKLGLRDRVQLALHAVRVGLVGGGDKRR